MTQREIVEFSTSKCVTSEIMEPIVKEVLSKNPDVSYTRINYDEEPDLVKAMIASQPPTISPFFVSFCDGKMFASAAGLISVDELSRLLKV
jgi:thioredoxin-like negative regulator of GroEL